MVFSFRVRERLVAVSAPQDLGPVEGAAMPY